MAWYTARWRRTTPLIVVALGAALAAVSLGPTAGGAAAQGTTLRSGFASGAVQRTTSSHQAAPVLPVVFEANKGQVAPQVRFLARGQGYTLYLTARASVLALPVPKTSHAPAAVVQLSFAGASSRARLVGLDALPGHANYFVGRNPSAWRTNIPLYGRVAYRDLYHGVDLVYHASGTRLEYNFIVAPGASPSSIHLAMKGSSKLSVDVAGSLVMFLHGGVLRQASPLIYQTIAGRRRLTPGRYTLAHDGSVGFSIGRYDAHLPLTIDPTLSYATYLGGGGYDVARAAASTNGAVYVTGQTQGVGFPTTTGAYSTTYALGGDIFVSKLNPAASGAASLVYSTYIGGQSEDLANAVAVDSAGSAYVAGYTSSRDYPTTTGAYSTTNPNGDVQFKRLGVLTRLDAAGSMLIYSTYIGGSQDNAIDGVAADNAGDAYVTGQTTSPSTTNDFPTTAGAFQTAFQGGTGSNDAVGTVDGDAFVSKFDTGAVGAASLVYSTYLGGRSGEVGRAVAVDATGAAYVVGQTFSSNFPTTTNAYSTTGTSSSGLAFVSKVNPAGSTLLYSTFLGGFGGVNAAYGLALSGPDNVYVVGQTGAADFPVTTNAYSTMLAGGVNAFAARLNTAASGPASLLYATYLGGSTGVNQRANAVAVDASGNAYVVGTTNATNFPTTSGAVAPTLAGGTDAFVAELSPYLDALRYSTYLGGSSDDDGAGVAAGAAGTLYVVGSTQSSNFPTTTGAYSSTNSGQSDAYVAAITGLPADVPAMAPTRTSTPSPTIPVATATPVPSATFTALPALPTTTIPPSDPTRSPPPTQPVGVPVVPPTQPAGAPIVPPTQVSGPPVVPPTQVGGPLVVPPTQTTSTPAPSATAGPGAPTIVLSTPRPTPTSSAARPAVAPTAVVKTKQPVVRYTTRYYLAGAIDRSIENSTITFLNASTKLVHVKLTLYGEKGQTFQVAQIVKPQSQQAVLVSAAVIPRKTFGGIYGIAVASDGAMAVQSNVLRIVRDDDSLLADDGLSKTWYLAEGFTGLTFTESVAILNPDAKATAHVRLRLAPSAGVKGRDVSIAVAPHSDRVVAINPLLPRQSLSIIATSDRLIAVERNLLFSSDNRGTGYGFTAREGTTTAATRWMFAEGTTANHFQTFLTILNPSASDAHVTARFYSRTGRVLSTRALTVGSLRRSTLRYNDFLSASGIASVVTSDKKIVVERPEYFGSPNVPDIAGSDVVGRTATRVQWSFPGQDTRGKSEFLLFFNPSSVSIPVMITVYGATGTPVVRKVVILPSARYTFDVGRSVRGVATPHGEMVKSLNGQGFIAEQTVFAPNRRTLSSTEGLAQ